MESILTTIKLQLGIGADYTHFDQQIMVHINSAFMTLRQLGVGPDKPIIVTSEMDTWDKVLGENESIEAIKLYIALKVRMLFDPPTSSFVLDAMNRQASELEWRLNVQATNTNNTEKEEEEE